MPAATNYPINNYVLSVFCVAGRGTSTISLRVPTTATGGVLPTATTLVVFGCVLFLRQDSHLRNPLSLLLQGQSFQFHVHGERTLFGESPFAAVNMKFEGLTPVPPTWRSETALAPGRNWNSRTSARS